MARVRQPGLDSGLGCQGNVIKPFKLFAPGSEAVECRVCLGVQADLYRATDRSSDQRESHAPNTVQIRQSRIDSGGGFQVEVGSFFQVVPSSLGSSRGSESERNHRKQ